jgi:hypothetical protein
MTPRLNIDRSYMYGCDAAHLSGMIGLCGDALRVIMNGLSRFCRA